MTTPLAPLGGPEPAREASFYHLVGGEPTFRALVREFYAGVADDPVLRPLYPEADLGPAAERLCLFLMQYWGGPATYSARRGHPRLRMRHASFRIGPVERDAWLSHMRRAVTRLELHPAQAERLWEYLEHAAHFMVNAQDEETPPGAPPNAPLSAPLSSPPGLPPSAQKREIS